MTVKLNSGNTDRAVSPVIGVILMVAITVILAAVIGAFVLGIGGDEEDTPQAQITLDCGEDNELEGGELSHNGGDQIVWSDIRIEQVTPDVEGQDRFSVGDDLELVDGSGTEPYLDVTDVDGSASVDISDDSELTMVHNPSDSILFERSC